MNKLKTALIILISITCVFISGCACGGAAFVPTEKQDSNKAVVYFYHPFSLMGGLAEPVIYIDEVRQNKLKNKGYLVYTMDPGKHIIEARDGSTIFLTMYPDIAAGKEYYFKWSLSITSSWGQTTQTYRFQLVPKHYAPARNNQYEKVKLTAGVFEFIAEQHRKQLRLHLVLS